MGGKGDYIMCHFVSWIEVTDNTGRVKNYYLTGNQVFDTPRGQLLRDWCQSQDDYVGHGAIRFFYEMDSGIGVERECTDFSSPDNFPPEIVSDIKSGKMRGLGFVSDMLSETGLSKYINIWRPAWDEYIKLKELKKEQFTWEKHSRDIRIALANYEEIRPNAFWDLFADINNRISAWR